MKKFSDGKGAHVTGVLLPHLIESLIFSGATEILITDSWRYSNQYNDESSKLPGSAQRYIKIMETNQRASMISDDLFNPILEDLGLENDRGGYLHKRDASSTEEEEARISAMSAHGSLPRFLEALFLKSHFHFDVKKLFQQLENVRKQSKNSETRISIAGIQGILSTYQPFDLAAASCISTASKSQAERLMEIILSSEFKALSSETSMLGGFTNIPHVISQINFRTRKLLNSNAAKGFLSYSQKAATAASGVPIPTTDLAESLLKDTFLPPTVDMTEIVSKAKENLSALNPELEGDEYIGF
jgi:hypothetical protein